MEVSTMKRWMPLLALCAFVALSAGCAPRVDDAERLNKALTYLPWTGTKGGIYVLRPIPGLQLALTSEYTERAGFNLRPPMLAQAKWIVPPPQRAGATTPYPAADRIFLSWLLQSAVPDDATASADALGLARNLELATAPASFDKDFLGRYYDAIASSLAVEYQPNAATANILAKWAGKHTAAQIAAIACHNGGPDDASDGIGTTGYATALTFVVPGPGGAAGTEFRTYNWTRFWGLEPLGLLTNPGDNNPEYASDSYPVAQGRGLLDVEIPIRFVGTPTSVFVSICTTVQDVESKWGVDVIALRRYKAWLPKELTAPANRVTTVATDDYGSLRFDPNWGLKSWLEGVTPVDAMPLSQRKSEILLAPGDVLYTRYRDGRASDVPPGWMVPPPETTTDQGGG
jgi:hypothetical protein